MANPSRYEILNNIETTLKGIKTSSGYKTTVRKVQRVPDNIVEVSGDELPFVGITQGSSRYQGKPGMRYRVVMEVSIHMHVIASSESDAIKKLNFLLDDVISAMHTDGRRGVDSAGLGNAVMTSLVSTTPEDYSDRNIGSMLATFEVVYGRTTASS